MPNVHSKPLLTAMEQEQLTTQLTEDAVKVMHVFPMAEMSLVPPTPVLRADLNDGFKHWFARPSSRLATNMHYHRLPGFKSITLYIDNAPLPIMMSETVILYCMIPEKLCKPSVIHTETLPAIRKVEHFFIGLNNIWINGMQDALTQKIPLPTFYREALEEYLYKYLYSDSACPFAVAIINAEAFLKQFSERVINALNQYYLHPSPQPLVSIEPPQPLNLDVKLKHRDRGSHQHNTPAMLKVTLPPENKPIARKCKLSPLAQEQIDSINADPQQTIAKKNIEKILDDLAHQRFGGWNSHRLEDCYVCDIPRLGGTHSRGCWRLAYRKGDPVYVLSIIDYHGTRTRTY
ncbi:hypothetical protein ACGVWS_08495 [Enterobacteriaceae bacterium LUAb1]